MSATPDTPDREAAAKKTHPAFTIICDNCRGHVVAVVSSLGYSEESGGWGSIDLVCQDCHCTTEIYAP